MPRPVSNPPNPWHSTHVEWLGEPPSADLQVYEEQARTVLTANDSPDIPFRYGVNPYRGCFHGCAYCYARASHELLDWGAGTDFERRLIVKVNTPECLSVELARPALRGQPITFSGNTDCYQPLEATYELTRRCLEVCVARRQPVALITKGALVQRDADLLARLAAGPGACVFFSIAFLDPTTARAVEPAVPTPNKRFEAMRALHAAGVPVGISIAPLIPGLNESDVPGLLERAAEAGADRAFLTLLHLSKTVRVVFEERIRATLPGRADHILSALADARGGKVEETAFFERMVGQGPRWKIVEHMFERTCERLGIRVETGLQMDRRDEVSPAPVQGELF